MSSGITDPHHCLPMCMFYTLMRMHYYLRTFTPPLTHPSSLLTPEHQHICASLLSTTKLADAGVGTKSSPQHLDLIDIHTSRLMDCAHWVQNLYKLQVDIIHSNELHLTQTHPPAKAPLALWHHQLSHTSEDTILKMVKAEAITGVALNRSGSQNCSACQKGKQMQNIIPQVTQEQSTEVLGWCRWDNSSQYKPPMESGLETQHMP